MSVTSPKVSVVCAWYNRADSIHTTIDSLLAQDFDNFDFLIINDGSPDPRVRKILDSYDDPRLRVVHQENKGFTSTIRRAVNMTTAPYIAIQGAGDESLPRRLRLQSELLDENEEFSAVGCNIEVMERNSKGEWSQQIMSRNYRARNAVDIISGGNPFSHGEVMIRREKYDIVGGYRLEFLFAQDGDLWLRLGEIGSFGSVSETLYVRRNFSDGIRQNWQKRLAQMRYADLGRQCYHERKKYGFDTVNLNGAQAALSRLRTRRVSVFCARQSVKCRINGNFSEANWLLEQSLDEGLNYQSCFAFVFSRLYRFGFFRYLLARMIRIGRGK